MIITCTPTSLLDQHCSMPDIQTQYKHMNIQPTDHLFPLLPSNLCRLTPPSAQKVADLPRVQLGPRQHMPMARIGVTIKKQPCQTSAPAKTHSPPESTHPHSPRSQKPHPATPPSSHKSTHPRPNPSSTFMILAIPSPSTNPAYSSPGTFRSWMRVFQARPAACTLGIDGKKTGMSVSLRGIRAAG